MVTNAATDVSSFSRRTPAKWSMARSVHRDLAASSCRVHPELGHDPKGSQLHRPVKHTLLTVVLLSAVFTALLFISVPSRRAFSIPLYARQTGQPCATCHTAFLELNPFGRRFKLGGYTLNGGDWTGPPFAVMLEAPTYTHTEAGQTGGAAPHFGTNNNFAFQQASLFTGGRFTDNLGAFIQGTYDGVARRFA